MQKDFNQESYRSVRSELLEWSYGTCQRADGSYYGHGGAQCKKGVEASIPEKDWVGKAQALGPKSGSAAEALNKKLASLPSSERKNWESYVDQSMGLPPKTNSSHGDQEAKPPEKIDKEFASRANSWNKMIDEGGQPHTLLARDGNTEDAPSGMTPRVTATGQRTWVNPDNGLVYSPKGDGIASQNRAGKLDTDRVAQEVVSFRRSQEQTGGKWPTQNLDPIDGKPMSADKIMAGLSKQDIQTLSVNGLAPPPKSGTGGPAQEVHRIYKNNPELAQARARMVVERYVEQGGRSGISGKPVALPGLKPKPGQESTSVDHFNPISGGKNKSPDQIRKKFDKKSNFLISEQGPNSQRGNRPWSAWGDKVEKGLTSGGSTPSRSQDSSRGNFPKVQKATTKQEKDLRKRIIKARQENRFSDAEGLQDTLSSL